MNNNDLPCLRALVTCQALASKGIQMEREARNPYYTRGSGGGLHNSGNGSSALAEPELLLHWGNRKRLRCVKVQRKEDAATTAPTVRVDRRVVRVEKDSGLAPLPCHTTPTRHRILRYHSSPLSVSLGIFFFFLSRDSGSNYHEKRGLFSYAVSVCVSFVRASGWLGATTCHGHALMSGHVRCVSWLVSLAAVTAYRPLPCNVW